ncbi:TetR/AcrR family transcriptional regulator [Sesbania bispinosa]|nr:TetR/AcrR family transcriptional regulator [Sesbania bispinosa]
METPIQLLKRGPTVAQKGKRVAEHTTKRPAGCAEACLTKCNKVTNSTVN